MGQDDSSRELQVSEPYMELNPGPFEEQLRAAPEYQSLQGSTATPEYDNVSGQNNTPEYCNIPGRYTCPVYYNVGFVRETTAQTREEDYEIGNPSSSSLVGS